MRVVRGRGLFTVLVGVFCFGRGCYFFEKFFFFEAGCTFFLWGFRFVCGYVFYF